MKKYFTAALLSLSFIQFSLAHSPFLSCRDVLEHIECTGSFSDGSSAFGIKIEVLNYSDELLFEGTLNKNNTIVFGKPDDEEYYVKFNGGPGHEFEVDYSDIQEQVEK